MLKVVLGLNNISNFLGGIKYLRREMTHTKQSTHDSPQNGGECKGPCKTVVFSFADMEIHFPFCFGNG